MIALPWSQLFSIIAPVMICAAIGFIWQRSGKKFDSDFIASLVMQLGAPCLIIASMSKVHASPQQLWSMCTAVLAISTGLAVCAAVLVWLFKLPWRPYVVSLVFSNSGNLGLPLCLLAFGDEGLALGVSYFVLLSCLHFSLGVVAFSARWHWRTLLLSPMLHAAWLGVLIVVFAWQLPLWLQHTVNLIGNFSIPLMLITLGVSLARIRFQALGWPALFAVLKIVLGLCIGWLVCEWLDLQGLMRGVVLLQSAMPMAIFNYLLAERYQQSPQQVAAMVAMSTLLAFMCLPWIVYVALQSQ